MKEIDEKDTIRLLEILDDDINLKCMQLKEEQKQLKYKKIFLLGCVLIFTTVILQILFSIFNFNIITIIFVYQGVILMISVPFIININKGVILK